MNRHLILKEIKDFLENPMRFTLTSFLFDKWSKFRLNLNPIEKFTRDQLDLYSTERFECY
ncbi:hypothetical protein Pint_19255 [Pistacia integerrima]|uniref:Uncharacterized protein n=1 Tax=Pistacia integerrima TaxID=434235 RepID=A0ACC0YZ09_9ROSI|nr:hypothetical protein Pint_19255 [Pistacia integerrima]